MVWSLPWCFSCDTELMMKFILSLVFKANSLLSAKVAECFISGRFPSKLEARLWFISQSELWQGEWLAGKAVSPVPAVRGPNHFTKCLFVLWLLSYNPSLSSSYWSVYFPFFGFKIIISSTNMHLSRSVFFSILCFLLWGRSLGRNINVWYSWSVILCNISIVEINSGQSIQTLRADFV